MANLDTSGLKKFRRWLKQYEMSHGSQPPQHLMSSFLEGEIEANIGRQQASRALGLQERQINIGEEQFSKTFDESQRQFGVQEERYMTQLEQSKNQFEQTFGEQKRQADIQAGQFNKNFAEAQRQFGIQESQWAQSFNLQKKSFKEQMDAMQLSGYLSIASIGINAFGAFAGTDWFGSIFSNWDTSALDTSNMAYNLPY